MSDNKAKPKKQREGEREKGGEREQSQLFQLCARCGKMASIKIQSKAEEAKTQKPKQKEYLTNIYKNTHIHIYVCMYVDECGSNVCMG